MKPFTPLWVHCNAVLPRSPQKCAPLKRWRLRSAIPGAPLAPRPLVVINITQQVKCVLFTLKLVLLKSYIILEYTYNTHRTMLPRRRGFLGRAAVVAGLAAASGGRATGAFYI